MDGRALALFLAGWLASFVAGCGSRTAPVDLSGDEMAVRLLISGLPDDIDSKKIATELFVEGAMPDDTTRKRMAALMFMPLDGIAIDGDTAKAEITVSDGSTGSELGKVEWSAVKQGGQWKLKTVPLP